MHPWDLRCSELQQPTSSSLAQLAYREWETKSYTGIWTVFPSVISLSVLKMSSLSKASEGNQTIKTALGFKLTCHKITTNFTPNTRCPSKANVYPWWNTNTPWILKQCVGEFWQTNFICFLLTF